MNKGGLLFEKDLDILIETINTVLQTFRDQYIDFVEIGTNEGNTSRVLIEHIKQKHQKFIYYGIDPYHSSSIDSHYVTDSHYVHYKKKSNEVIDYFSRIHWCFIDGCHCRQCVIRDAILYGNKLAKNGLLVFHDASPLTQGRDPQDYDSDHSKELAHKGIDVRLALDLDLLAGFKLVIPSLLQEYGGVEVYQKL